MQKRLIRATVRILKRMGNGKWEWGRRTEKRIGRDRLRSAGNDKLLRDVKYAIEVNNGRCRVVQRASTLTRKKEKNRDRK